MSKNAAFTQTRAASETIELISMADVVPAFTALYGSIDVLKHRRSKLIRKKKGDCGIPIDALNTVSLNQAIKKRRTEIRIGTRMAAARNVSASASCPI
jgi:hypothetical protein